MSKQMRYRIAVPKTIYPGLVLPESKAAPGTIELLLRWDIKSCLEMGDIEEVEE